jgi:glucosylceramidase
MKFIKRGALRIKSTEGTRDFANVALLNPDGEIVLVVVNRAAAPASFAVVYRKRVFKAALPPECVATFTWSR